MSCPLLTRLRPGGEETVGNQAEQLGAQGGVEGHGSSSVNIDFAALAVANVEVRERGRPARSSAKVAARIGDSIKHDMETGGDRVTVRAGDLTERIVFRYAGS